MPQLPRTHPLLAPRTLAAALVLALCAALLFAATAPASAGTRGQAAKKALAALGSTEGSDPVIVFGLMKPLRAGARVTQAGTTKRVVKLGGERAFFFYEDSGPFEAYPHGGRVALVGAQSGKVRLSKAITRRPLVNGKLPAFLKNAKRYGSSKYRVFFRAASAPASPTPEAGGPLFVSGPFSPFSPGTPLANSGASNSPPKANRQELTVKQDRPKNITLTGSDDDGEPITFHITKQPDHGTLSGTPPDMTYTPGLHYLGHDDFSFRTRDDDSDSNTAKITLTVVPLGQPPAVTTSSGCTAYTEQAPAVVIDDLLTVSDPDDTTLDSATVRIAANFQDGDDLVFTDQNGISSFYDDSIGVLTLTGTSSVANYQTALRSVRYRNQASGNATATKDVAFTVNDAGSDSAPATKQICIAGGTGGANNRPVGETSEGGLSYVENDGPVPVDSGFVVGDPDSVNLSGATIKFIPVVSQPVDENGDPVGPPTTTVTFAPAEDALAFENQNGISGSYDAESGILTLSGTSSLANYETAIRSVTYENSSENPSDATRRLQFQVTDSSSLNSTPSRRDVFITPVNDAPVVTTTEGSTSYTGDDPPAAIDSGLTVGDVDDTNIEGSQVRISSGFEAGDTLGFGNQNGITGSYDGDAGVLTLSGSATVADYETALRSVTYSNTAGNPSGSRTVDFTVNDGDLDSGVASKNLELNDKPILDTSSVALSYTEGDGQAAVDPGLTATDADSPDLSGATVQITAGFISAEDDLTFADTPAITGSYDDDTGTLTLSGTAPVADYEAALRSVTYSNFSENPSGGTRTVTFQATDGAAINNLSDPVTRDIEVTPVNDAPVVTTSEGSTLYIIGDTTGAAVDPDLNVTDVDDTEIESGQVRISSGFEAGDELVFDTQAGISGAYDSDTGILTLTGTATSDEYQTALRSIKYRTTGASPAPSRTVEFTVNDGDADSAAATKDIGIAPPNDKPVLDTTDTALSYTEGSGAVAVDSQITATDTDSTNLAGATIQITDGFSSGEDRLAFVDQSGITSFYDEELGVLTLSGSATVAEYQAALQSVTYANSSTTPSTAPRTVTFQATDGALTNNLSDPVSREIDVIPTD